MEVELTPCNRLIEGTHHDGEPCSCKNGKGNLGEVQGGSGGTGPVETRENENDSTSRLIVVDRCAGYWDRIAKEWR